MLAVLFQNQMVGTKKILIFIFVFTGLLFCAGNAGVPGKKVEGIGNEKQIADFILTNVIRLYDVPEHGLLSETYPINPDHKVNYLAEGSTQKQKQEVSFLWPYSGVISGTVALYALTKEQKYLDLMEKRLLPGLEKYLDRSRQPGGYQSYPTFAGRSDRFYDDNVWLALDFCSLYASTKNKRYLDNAVETYDFVYSGWDGSLNGGIYWCEQKKTSKNTCSNAPSAVLSARLYQLTGDEKFLSRAIETYLWTKKKLWDPADFVYWDNVALNGDIDKRKYTYNSGQMIEAGVLLFQLTGDKEYLVDAQKTASGVYQHFTTIESTVTGSKVFYPDSPWFNVILFRGLKALFLVDGNGKFVQAMMENAHYAWNNTADENNLLGKSWSEKSTQPYKWLLDNACMIELFAELADTHKRSD